MAVTTTAFSSLLKKLSKDFSAISFKAGDEFRWSSSTHTVWYVSESNDTVTLLHETAHGILEHSMYSNDIELLRLERDAWTKAIDLGVAYGVTISDEHVESSLDTYRDWLHTRSLCPTCQQNGIQENENQYLCVICGQKWRVNDARHCSLKRRKIQ